MVMYAVLRTLWSLTKSGRSTCTCSKLLKCTIFSQFCTILRHSRNTDGIHAVGFSALPYCSCSVDTCRLSVFVLPLDTFCRSGCGTPCKKPNTVKCRPYGTKFLGVCQGETYPAQISKGVDVCGHFWSRTPFVSEIWAGENWEMFFNNGKRRRWTLSHHSHAPNDVASMRQSLHCSGKIVQKSLDPDRQRLYRHMMAQAKRDGQNRKKRDSLPTSQIANRPSFIK